MRKVRLAAAALLFVVACNARPGAVAAPPPSARFEIHLDARDAHALSFVAHFIGGRSADLAVAGDMVGAITNVEVARAGGWSRLEPAHMNANECATDCTVRYTLDLAHAATSHEGIISVGHGGYLAASSTWLMHPSPMPRGTFEISIDPATEAPVDRFVAVAFATGMRRRAANDARHFVMSTSEFSEGSYAAFGAIRHRLVKSAGGEIEVVGFAEPKLALSDDELATWVREDGECVAQLYGHYPVARATVFVVPLQGADEVVFGRVLSLGGASIALLTGTELTSKNTHADWVLVHEMVHLGFPTVFRERWIGEGLATYYEPVLRTRMGWRPRERLWNGFAREMRRGVPAVGDQTALDKRGSIDDVYWGGAVFIMMADVGIRVATQNRKSLDSVMRAILARGGDATVAWSLDEILAVAETETGTKLMSALRDRLAVRGERVDLGAYFGKLGVTPGTDHALLGDNAEWSAIRAAIESKNPVQ